MRKLGALWCRTSKKDGMQFMTGTLEDMRGDIKIVVFRNTKKEKENQPDYQIYLSEDRDESRPQSPSGQDPMMAPTVAGAPQNQGGDEIDISTIPF